MTSFNFLIPALNDEHFRELVSADVDDQYHLFDLGYNIWSLQTYLILRKMISNVSCSRFPKSDAINIGHSQYWRTIIPDQAFFVVSVAGEYRLLAWAHAHIVQNKKQEKNPNKLWIPHWGQPGLIPRSPDRKAIKTIAYAGNLNRLSVRRNRFLSKFARFGRYFEGTKGTDFWKDEAKRIGLRFKLMTYPNWNDYSDVDILLGIRSYDKETYDYLPPTKLFNAWQAGIPFIGGCDSAFEQVGRPGRDYIQVKNHKEALQEIQRLRNDTGYYQGFVEAGRQKIPSYTRGEIAKFWIRILSEKISALYEEWRQRSSWSRSIHIQMNHKIDTTIRKMGRLTRLPSGRRL